MSDFRQGMLLDADTLCLWRFGGQTITVADDTGAYPLYTFPTGGTPWAGVGSVYRGSAIDAGQGWEGFPNAAARTALLGAANFSIEARLTIAKRQSGTAEVKYITAYGGATANPADNFLAGFWISRGPAPWNDADELPFVGIGLYWEDLTNVDGNGTSFTSPLLVPTGVPVHVAVVKTGGIGGTVEWFLNGVSIGVATINTFISAGGDNYGSVRWAVGKHPLYAGAEFAMRGLIEEVRWSKKARTAAEILASAQRGSLALPAVGPLGHTVDANTFAMWRFDDGYPNPNGNVGVSDSAPGARHLLPIATAAAPSGAWPRLAIFPSPVRNGGCLQNGDPFSGYRASRATDLALRQMLRGEWTIEFLYMPYPSMANQGTLLCHSIGTPNSTPANFDCLMVRTDPYLGGEVNVLGAGWSHPTTGVRTMVYPSYMGQQYRNTHWAIRKTLSGPTATLEFFANGVKTGYLNGSNGQLPNLTADSDGSNGTMNIGGLNDQMFGQLDDVRISNIARTYEEIMADFIACFGGSGMTTVSFEPTVVSRMVNGRVRLSFSEQVLDSVSLRNPANYSVTAPANANALSVFDVRVADEYTIDLGISGSVSTVTYDLDIAAGALNRLSDGAKNLLIETTFEGVATSYSRGF